MSTRIIEPPVSTSTPQRKSVTPRRSHPVAIEIPVTVQGSHSAPGRQLPQQFVEETRTVLVFVEGGVLRTSEEVSPGQFLILKNLYNGEETPCVVAPKNIGSAKGYVEVEFAQPVDDFWGIDFATGQPKDALIPPLANEALPAGTKPVASEKIGAVSPIAPAVAPEAAPPSPVDAEMMKRALDAAFSSLPVSSPEPAAVEPSKPRDGVAQSTPVSTWAKPPVWTEAPARPAVAAKQLQPTIFSSVTIEYRRICFAGCELTGIFTCAGLAGRRHRAKYFENSRASLRRSNSLLKSSSVFRRAGTKAQSPVRLELGIECNASSGSCNRRRFSRARRNSNKAGWGAFRMEVDAYGIRRSIAVHGGCCRRLSLVYQDARAPQALSTRRAAAWQFSYWCVSFESGR